MKHCTAVKEIKYWHAAEVQAAGGPIRDVAQGLLLPRSEIEKRI